MNPRSFLRFVRGGQVPLLLGLSALAKPMYRASFLAAARTSGLLDLLARGPQPLSRIAALFDATPDQYEMLEAWLDLGARLGELERTNEGWALSGWWAKRLARRENDVAAAALEEMVRYHQSILFDVPSLIRERRRLSLADQDGALIARATRVLEPFVEEAIDDVIPERGPLSILEIGCGEAGYIRHALARNPDATALGLELQEDVARVARDNLAAWGLAGRAEIALGDIRTFDPGRRFDVVTMHNNIYYFAFEERVPLLERLRTLLAPNGRLLLTTGCAGGNLSLSAVSLWFSAAEAGGRVPEADEMVAQLEAAGFSSAQKKSLLPGDAYCSFVGMEGSRVE